MKTLFLFLMIAFVAKVDAQERFYAYKEDWSNTTDLKVASFFRQVIKVNDTTYVSRYYNMYGPMLRLETYRDEKLTVPNGRFIWYNEKGVVDSTGHVLVGGKKDGLWRYHTHPDSSGPTITELYDNGKFLWKRDIINNRMTYADGKSEPVDKPAADTFITTQVEASFPKGVEGWRRYLERNFETPSRFEQSVKGRVKATVIVAFMVDPDGNIRDVYPIKSVEWSLDTAVQQLFLKGPKWIPATQNGKKVPYFQRQSVTVVVENE